MHMLHTTYLVLSYVRFYPCPNAVDSASHDAENHFLFFFFFFFWSSLPARSTDAAAPLGRLTSEN